MPKLSRILAAAVCAGAVAFVSTAHAESLKAGDAAPALGVAKFVKGEPVKGFEKGKIYVVEFWATWCPPCRESIPHLTEMQKANKDVVFIGVDVGEDEATVMPFVTKMADKMEYRVALDDLTKNDGATNAAYMSAAGQNGIPTAFIIDKDSKVAWIGHPMEMEKPLGEIVAGKFDVKKAAAAAETKNKLGEMLNSGDFDGALKAIDETVAADPSMADELGLLQFQILAQGKKDLPAAAKKAETLFAKVEEPMSLNMMAWTLATAENAPADTLACALKIAEKANTKSGGKDPQILDTLARVHAAQKDFAKAVELQTLAVANATDEMKQDLQATLDAYKAGKLPEGE